MRWVLILVLLSVACWSQTTIQPQDNGHILQQQVTGKVGLNAMGGLKGSWNPSTNTFSIDASGIPDISSVQIGAFPGVAKISSGIGTATQQINDAMAAAGGSSAAIFAKGSSVGNGTTTGLLFDFRKTTDVFGTAGDPDRMGALYIKQLVGDFITRPLTGTVTFVNGSRCVIGSETLFSTQLDATVHIGRSIKANTAPSSAWAQVDTSAGPCAALDNTHTTLTAAYTGPSTSGPASYNVTLDPIIINAHLTDALAAGPANAEWVGLSILAARDSGTRPTVGANINITYYTRTVADVARAQGLEIDISNKTGTDSPISGGGTAGNLENGIFILSAGLNRVPTGIIVSQQSQTNAIERPIWINGFADCTGTVNTNGTAVTWVSGCKFDNFAVLAQADMVINSVRYVISTCASTTACTLISTAGVQNGVAFIVNQFSGYHVNGPSNALYIKPDSSTGNYADLPAILVRNGDETSNNFRVNNNGALGNARTWWTNPGETNQFLLNEWGTPRGAGTKTWLTRLSEAPTSGTFWDAIQIDRTADTSGNVVLAPNAGSVGVRTSPGSAERLAVSLTTTTGVRIGAASNDGTAGLLVTSIDTTQDTGVFRCKSLQTAKGLKVQNSTPTDNFTVACDGTITTASSTLVANLNASQLESKTWEVPGTIGSTTPNSGAFTTVSASGVITSTVATGTAPFTIASTTQVTNLNSSTLLGSTWAAPPTIGSTTPNAVVTTVTVLTAAASNNGAGTITLGNGTAATATNGTGEAMKANVEGYLIINVGGTTVKIPYVKN